MSSPSRVALCSLLLVAACHGATDLSSEPDPIEPVDAGAVRVDRGTVAFDPITEASGLAASRRNADVLWTHNDSGDGPRLFALSTHGAHLGVYTLSGANALDWEDLAVGPGPDPGQSYLYVGDIGDNAAQRPTTVVYRVPEPTVDAAQAPVDTTLTGVTPLTFRYPDGPCDAETLLVDPLTGDLYVVTKRSATVVVYRAATPLDASIVTVMERVGTLTLDPIPGIGDAGQGATGGDVAPSGLAVLLKSYGTLYRWRRLSADAPLFASGPVRLPYVPEPQGEAVAWSADGQGYFTLSEELQGIPAHLYFYPVPYDE